MDTTATKNFISSLWDSSVIPIVEKYIAIPNQSPEWEPNWEEVGNTQKAIDLLVSWVHHQNVPDLKLQVIKEAKRTPIIFLELPASENCKTSETVLMYGHMDKQPPLTEEWDKELGPYKPVIKDGKLYGRGGADDGYSIFSAVSAVMAIKKQGASHPRIGIVIESCEESGSVDLPYYMQKLYPVLGDVGLIICLDSGCGNYEQFWLTTSLRGIADGTLRVRVLREGVHSGDASGTVPSTFRVLRLILNRLEDAETGRILLGDAHIEIPEKRVEQAKQAAKFLEDATWDKFPWVEGAQPTTKDHVELVLNRTWRPQLSYVGASGFPSCHTAGNVLRAETAVKLSLRLPPTVSAAKAEHALKKLLEHSPPYGCKVTFECGGDPANGWESPILADWLEKSINDSSLSFFKKPSVQMGEGGSIPFMAMLGEQFPKAQFVITGVLGPGSNAHGPNEFLHIEMAKNVTSCVAHILHDFCVAKTK